MKYLVNDRDAIVTEALDGVVLASGGTLARLDGYPSIKVVLRTDWDRSKVALVSGGGSGHEPAHVGFVGKGMLTAAVCGDIFASPSVDAVLAAILSVTGPAGCLLIVKNYTGDRLNFGLAAERARGLGLDVEMVVVGDDVATAGKHPRGIAGTVLVHKVAGHAAEQGGSLAEVREAAARTAAGVATIGLSLTTCNVPGLPADARIGEAEVEIGLGIHGEPGVLKVPMADARSLMALLLKQLAPAIADSDAPLALLINNLGGLPPIELAVATRALLDGGLGARVELVIGPAALMTALDMKGLSVTVLPLDAPHRLALCARTEAPAWPGARAAGPLLLTALPAGMAMDVYAPSSDAAVRSILALACEEIIRQEKTLNALDAKVGDGDTGSTLAAAARDLLECLDELPLAEPARLCGAISDRLSRVMGGSSGVLLSIFFAAAGKALHDGAAWPTALHAGVLRMQAYGGAAEGDRTMIDALLPAIRSLEAGGDFAAAATAAAAGAKATEGVGRTQVGRSSYLSEVSLLGVPDPGAAGVAMVFARLAAG